MAHPHIFIDAHATIVFDENGAVTSIHNSWTFDETFSAWQIQGLDTNNDGVTSSEEMQELADDNMSGLAEYQYYTFAGEGDDENLSFTNGRNPKFVYKDGRSTLDFDVDLVTPYQIRDTLEVAINDPEYYAAITFADASTITLQNAPAGCSVSLDPPKTMDDAVANELYSLPPDVTELPPDLAAALRGVQGAILVHCPAGATPAQPTEQTAAATAPEAATALEAVTNVAQSKSAIPFGGPPPEPGLNLPKTGFFGWVAEQQRQFYLALTNALAALQTDANAFWILGGLSFLYGVFHAAGPGHGKVVISSYVLANERQVRRGVLLSFAAAMVQSLVAIGFVLIASAALSLTATAMSDAANWIGIVSYALVALLGLWLIARHVFAWGHHHHHHEPADLAQKAHTHLHAGQSHALNRGRQSLLATTMRPAFAGGVDAYGRAPSDPHYGHDHGPGGHGQAHDHDEHVHAITPAQLRGGWREQLGVVFAVGLRPCSGALVVLAFAYSQGLLFAGIVAVLLMGLGTAITVAILATVAVTLKDFALRMGGADNTIAAALVWWAELLGAILVFGFGVVLLIASF